MENVLIDKNIKVYNTKKRLYEIDKKDIIIPKVRYREILETF